MSYGDQPDRTWLNHIKKAVREPVKSLLTDLFADQWASLRIRERLLYRIVDSVKG